jgi:hypothetical protein
LEKFVEEEYALDLRGDFEEAFVKPEMESNVFFTTFSLRIDHNYDAHNERYVSLSSANPEKRTGTICLTSF